MQAVIAAHGGPTHVADQHNVPQCGGGLWALAATCVVFFLGGVQVVMSHLVYGKFCPGLYIPQFEKLAKILKSKYEGKKNKQQNIKHTHARICRYVWVCIYISVCTCISMHNTDKNYGRRSVILRGKLTESSKTLGKWWQFSFSCNDDCICRKKINSQLQKKSQKWASGNPCRDWHFKISLLCVKFDYWNSFPKGCGKKTEITGKLCMRKLGRFAMLFITRNFCCQKHQ